MKKQSKPDIQKEVLLKYAMDEYKIIWDYYKHTIQERENSYDRYFKVIAFPGTVISGLITLSNSLSFDNARKLILFASFSLGIISIVGISIYITYILEMIVSERYLKLIRELRFHFSMYDSFLADFFTGIIPSDEKEKYSVFGNTKLARSMAIPLINSSFIPIILYLNNIFNLYVIALLYILVFALHMFVFSLLKNYAPDEQIKLFKNKNNL